MAASSTATNTHQLLRRLSMSGDSQWTQQQQHHQQRGSSSPSGAGPPSATTPTFSSGYALSPTSGTHRQAPLPSPSASSVSGASNAGLQRRSSMTTSSSASTSLRQLNPASIFSRLGLPTSSAAGAASGADASGIPNMGDEYSAGTSVSPVPSPLLSPRATGPDGDAPHPHLSPGQREDLYLPTSDFEGLSLSSGGDERTSSSDTTTTHGAGAQDSTITSRTSFSLGNSGNKIISIPAEVLLPFVDRPTEVRELLEQTQCNRGLYDNLKERFSRTRGSSVSINNTTSSSPVPQDKDASTHFRTRSQSGLSSSISSAPATTWAEVEVVLYRAREELGDQEWIDALKALIFPRSTPLWERLRACLGIDVDDERGGDRYEELSSDIAGMGMGMGIGMGMETPIAAPSGVGQPDPTSPSPGFFPAGLTENHATPSDQDADALLSSSAKVAAPSLADEMLSPRAVLRQAGNASTGTVPLPLGAGGQTAAPTSAPVPATAAQGPALGNAGTSPASSRMHRRTSSGGSSGFRRSFAMSSISENAAVDKFEDSSNLNSAPHPPSPGSSAPSSLLQTPEFGDAEMDYAPPLAAAQTQAKKMRVDPGLLAHAGFEPLSGSALSTSSSMGTIPVSPSSASIHLHTNEGPALPPTGSPSLTPSSSLTSSLGLSLSGGSSPQRSHVPASPSQYGAAFAGGPARRASSSAGLHSSGFSASGFGLSPSKRAYDEYTAVFDSDDGGSVAGSVRSTGRGPGMRFSFGAAEASKPSGFNRSGAGFALAGINQQKLGGAASGQSTPRAGSMSKPS